MPRVLISPRKELMRNAAAAAANVLTDDDLLKLVLENHGLYASRFARVCKQWKRAAAAVKLSGQTLETEPHVSCARGSAAAGASWSTTRVVARYESICGEVVAQFVHVLCKVGEEREELLHIRDYDSDGEELLFEEEQEDGHPMHSLVGFRIRA